MYLAEDIVQNVFLKLWQKRDKLNTKFSIKGFLYRSVYNEFIDLYRKKTNLTIVEEQYINKLKAIATGELSDKTANLIALVKKEIENLPPKCKQMFLLSKKEGLTNVEIAEKIGTTTQRTRHTVTKMGSRLGLDDKKIDRYLNHSTSGVIKHYLDKEQVEQDVFQIHIFQEFGLLQVVKMTFDFFKKRTVRVNEKDVPFIPLGIVDKKVQGRTVPILHRSTILSRGILTKFSREDEVRYQTLLNDIKEGTRVIENGRIVRKEVAKNKYPKELQKLIEKRKQLYVKPPKFKQELLDKIDVSINAVQVDSPQVAKAKEILKLDES